MPRCQLRRFVPYVVSVLYLFRNLISLLRTGHYDCHGINVQGVSDEKGKFIYFAVAGPGAMHDQAAYEGTTLPSLVESLPVGTFIIADNAYTATEHLIPVYGGLERLEPGKDDTNYYFSQVRIHIERAFGIMKRRFAILSRPINVSMNNVSPLLMSIARIHNFSLNYTTDDEFFHESVSVSLRDPNTDVQLSLGGSAPGQSSLQKMLHERVQEKGLKRP